MRHITNNEIVCKSYSDALSLTKILLNNGYVILISKEENLFIVNYEWSSKDANRNDVIFLNREDFEDEWFNAAED